jgi:hypothetical protein
VCLIAAIALLSPRLALAIWWIFGNKVDAAFDSSWVPLLGLIFLPWTTLAYVAAWQPGGLDGNWDAILVGLGIVADIVTYMHRFAARSVRRSSY